MPGLFYKPAVPFVPAGPLNPPVIWHRNLAITYLFLILQLPNPLKDLLRQDFIVNGRWAATHPSGNDFLSKTLSAYNAMVPGPDWITAGPRQPFILFGFNPLGIHIHVPPDVIEEFKCPALEILNLMAGDAVLKLALKFGVPLLASALLTIATEIIGGILLENACPKGNGPQTPQGGTPDPWGYYGR